MFGIQLSSTEGQSVSPTPSMFAALQNGKVLYIRLQTGFHTHFKCTCGTMNIGLLDIE